MDAEQTNTMTDAVANLFGNCHSDGYALSKHLLSNHPKEFESLLFQSYGLACRLSQLTVEIALKKLSFETFGLE